MSDKRSLLRSLLLPTNHVEVGSAKQASGAIGRLTRRAKSRKDQVRRADAPSEAVVSRFIRHSKVSAGTDVRGRRENSRAGCQAPRPADPLTNALIHDLNHDFFGDGGPTWKEGRRRKPNQTAAEAAAVDEQTIARLRRSRIPDAMALANRLHEDPHAPTLALTVFGRAFQKADVVVINEAVRGCLGNEVLLVSVVYRDAGAWMRGLQADPFAILRDQLHAAFHAAGISMAIGGFDLSANEHHDGVFRPHYRPQGWFFVRASEFRAGEKVFRSYFPRSTTVPRPVRALKWDGRVNACAYCLKPNFWRRVTVEVEDNDRGYRKSVQRRPLRVAQVVETTLMLDRLRPTTRMIVYGLRFVRNEDGEPILVRRR